MIRSANLLDTTAICEIYNHYVTHTIVTFEETAVSAAEMEERIRIISAKYPYLAWEDSEGINGYAYVNKWKERVAYRQTAELSIYVRNGFQGRGIGRKLMDSLLNEIYKTDIHVLISGIVIPNDICIALHEKFGFKKIAHFSEVGFKFGKWLDVGNWELILK